MTSNPIIQYELLGLLRTNRAIMIQIGLVIVLNVVVLAMWPADAAVNLGGRQAQQLFSTFMYGLLICMLMITPVFPATAIVRERQRNTLVLLLTSRMSPISILIGKVSAAFCFILLILLLSLPAASACFTMGGITFGNFVAAYAVLGLCAAEVTMIGLLVSSYAKSNDSALRVTYGIILVMTVIVLGPYYMLHGRLGGSAEQLIEWLRAVSPIPAIMSVLGHGQVGARGLVADTAASPVTRYLITALVVIGYCAMVLLSRLRPQLLDQVHAKGKVTDDRSRDVRILRRLLYIVDPQRRSGLIGPLANPVMVKEFRSRKFGRLHWMLRTAGLCLLISMTLMYVATLGTMFINVEYMSGVLVVFQMGLLVLIAPALSSTLISGEVESKGWQQLQLTPLSAFSIVTGKLLSVVWTLVMLLVASLPCYGLLLMIDEGYQQRVIDVVSSLCLTALYAMLVGAACSSVFKRSTAATTCAYLILVVQCVGTLLPWLGEGSFFGRGVVEWFLVVNPVAAALSVIQMPGMADYEIIKTNQTLLIAGSVACVLMLWVRTYLISRPK